MSIDKMSKQQEAELVDSVMQAIKFANAGMHPNEAITKVASDRGWNKHFIKRAVEAFNTSKAIKHRKDAQGEEKAATYELADPESVIKSLYPDNVETPAEVKQAEWEPTGIDVEETRVFNLDTAPVVDRHESNDYRKDLEMLMKRACDEQHRQEVEVSDLRQKMASARIRLSKSLQKLAEYFRVTGHEPFEKVESAVLQFDPTAKCVMDTVWTLAKCASFKTDKRASSAAKVVYGDRTPYAVVSEIFAARDAYSHAAVKCAKASEELADYKLNLHERMTKLSAGLESVAPFMLGRLLPSAVGFSDSSKSPEDITSVQFDAERKSIQAQAMLHDLMQHDEVLRKADPKKVLSAYNDISSLAPRAAESPLIMRGLLRKSVETNSYDPYESANLVSIETGLKKKDAPMGAKVD